MFTTINRIRKSEEGFTLIELMIVMIVLGILAGIVLFAVGAFDDQATTAKDDANDRICASAIAAAAASPDTSDSWSNYVEGSVTCTPTTTTP